MVLPPYTPALGLPNCNSRETLILGYFHQGYTNREMLASLLTRHATTLSLSHLKRILRGHGLRRRNKPHQHLPVNHIMDAINSVTENSGMCLGYRTVRKRIRRQYKFVVPRNIVMELMRVIDADGVGKSNKHPATIASYFLETVKQVGGCPRTIRSDLGTENVHVEKLQTLFHSLYGRKAEENCFMYGKSTSNQRIEAWWSILRRHAADCWIIFFKELRNSGLFNDSDPLHVECPRYCFMRIIQKELDSVAIEWNQHTLQVKRNSQVPRGKPDVMFFTPVLYNTDDFILDCPEEEIDIFKQLPEFHQPGIDEQTTRFHELVELLLPDVRILPNDVNEASELYARLIGEINRYK